MKNKIALLADVHGNSTALESVLKDCEHREVSDYWILGDLFLPGPGGKDILKNLRAVTPSAWIRGNWDDCFLDVVDKKIDFDDPTDVYVGMLASIIIPQFDQADIDFFKKMPIQRIKKIAGLNISLTHNLPEINYGGQLHPSSNQSEFDKLFSIESDIAVYAHVHHQTLRYSSNDQIIINPGSIGQPFNGWKHFKHDRRAHYAILEVEDGCLVNVDFRRISYDVEKELKRAQEANLPFYNLYEEMLYSGKTYTHDAVILGDLIEKNNYKERLTDFLSS
ncbi:MULTISPECIES: metallophosphoesterase family protein [unclassified Enterococcus]|uniref:metallophosphoesterase family protein n=1 Tax=unclassified Enterococcus TaxID=2608891 RepID=UPI001CE22C9C|nr:MULTISPECIES: metallophosphoesterase family protein [unclassified Enterococcus]MCA5011819.1 metallophosphoesterase family protein [Enterococcus sp. S23]MCA5014739.1 metallophosphoesterase family protein [Enterococcus sp. S22(2020)]